MGRHSPQSRRAQRSRQKARRKLNFKVTQQADLAEGFSSSTTDSVVSTAPFDTQPSTLPPLTHDYGIDLDALEMTLDDVYDPVEQMPRDSAGLP